MNPLRFRMSPLASLCAICFPFTASAAGLTITQQGVVSASAAKGAQRAVFVEASVSADCDKDVTVDSLVVRHRGFGEASDVERVYATDGETRLSHARALDSSDRKATIEFTPALTVGACTTKRVQVRGDFSSEATVAGQHGLLIESVKASAPVTLSSSKPATITTRPLRAGAVSASFLPLPRALMFGKNRTVAKFRLEADRIANQRVSSITLTNAGKARGADLSNLRVVDRKGSELTNVAATLDDDRVRLAFTPALDIDSNESVLLELKADITASKRRTIRFMLEEPSDLEASVRAR